MNIFKQIKNSIFGPDYYQNTVIKSSLRDAIKYATKLSLMVAVIIMIVFAFLAPEFYKGLKTFVSDEIANYPEDLVLNIKDGVASVNKPEPYSLQISPTSKVMIDSTKNSEVNMLVVDTTKTFNIDTFHSYSTLSLLTKNELILPKDSKGTLQIIPLSEFGNVVITKSLLSTMEAKFHNFLPMIMVFMVLFVFIGVFIGYFVSFLIMSLLYALFVWLLAKVKDFDLNFKDSYKVALHSYTILIILSFVAMFVPVLKEFLIRLVAILIVVYINLFPDTPKQEKVEVTS